MYLMTSGGLMFYNLETFKIYDLAGVWTNDLFRDVEFLVLFEYGSTKACE